MRRRNVLLAALLGVLIAANLVVGPPDRSSAAAAPLFPRFEPSLAA